MPPVFLYSFLFILHNQSQSGQDSLLFYKNGAKVKLIMTEKRKSAIYRVEKNDIKTVGVSKNNPSSDTGMIEQSIPPLHVTHFFVVLTKALK